MSTSLERSTTARPGPCTATGVEVLRQTPSDGIRKPGRRAPRLGAAAPDDRARDLGAVEELDAVGGDHRRAVRALLLEDELPVTAQDRRAAPRVEGERHHRDGSDDGLAGLNARDRHGTPSMPRIPGERPGASRFDAHRHL